MNDQTTLDQKRPVLHKLIDELPAEELHLVELLLARLEVDRLWAEISQGFTEDWTRGSYERLDEVIKAVRNTQLRQ
jgi:hypothetical protein